MAVLQCHLWALSPPTSILCLGHLMQCSLRVQVISKPGIDKELKRDWEDQIVFAKGVYAREQALGLGESVSGAQVIEAAAPAWCRSSASPEWTRS